MNRVAVPFTGLVALWLMTGCTFECEEGDVENCDCGINSYANHCDPKGFFPTCDCYGVAGHGEPSGEADADDLDGMPDGEKHDTLLDYFPGCAATYRDDCDEGETKIPCTNLCLNRCAVGTSWTGDGCDSLPFIGSLDVILGECQALDARYRLLTLDELAPLLNLCTPAAFNSETTNFCGPMAASAFRFLVDLDFTDGSFDTWLGALDTCVDHYDQSVEGCAWMARLWPETPFATELNWLLGNATPGSALAGGLCVRVK